MPKVLPFAPRRRPARAPRQLTMSVSITLGGLTKALRDAEPPTPKPRDP